MAPTHSPPAENRFDRGAWLTVAFVVGFCILALTTTLYILAMPTDGWQIPYNSISSPPLENFAGDWPTPLRAGDQILAVDGMKVAGGEGIEPLPARAWQDGHSVTYSILRGKQHMQVPVTLHRLDLAGILRSFWHTMRDTPMVWFWSLIAILVFLLRPRNTGARLMLLAMVPGILVVKLAWAATTVSHNFAPAPVFYLQAMADAFWVYLTFPAFILLALTFPQRVFPLTRWPRALPLLLFGIALVLSLLSIATQSMILANVILVAEAVLLFLSFGAALFNMRKLANDPVSRAQAVWVIFGFSLSTIPVLVGYLLGEAGYLNPDYVSSVFSYLLPLILPVCLAIAITRYHLFDIYLIIRRTLQYTLLTGLLALVYFGAVVLLQSLFGIAGFGKVGSGSTQDFAIVLSTLAIAALFTPLRRRVQQFIDRRFFRSQYNADQVLARYAATARDEVAIEPLTAALLKAVEETLRPEETSLWLRPRADR